MRTRHLLQFTLSAILALSGIRPALAGHPEDVAMSLYPQTMIEAVQAQGGPSDLLRLAAVTAQLDGPGGPSYIVAGYANSLSGDVQVIRDGDAPVVADAIARQCDVVGDSVSIETKDLDHDGRPEIIASFHLGRGDSTWVFAWKNSRLVNMSPMSDQTTDFGTPLWVDIDGDGTLEAISDRNTNTPLQADGTHDPVVAQTIYHLANGKYKADAEMFGSLLCVAKMAPCERDIALGRTDVDYRARIINGMSGTTRADTADVVWNGNLLTNPANFSKDIGWLKTRVSPKRQNSLVIRSISPSKATVFVLIEPTQPIVPFDVKPTLNCVWDEGQGLFTAQFSYRNPNPSQTIVPVGPRNQFAGQRPDRGQPSAFTPGNDFEGFEVQSNGEPLVWTLQGNDVKATLASQRCEGTSPLPRNNSQAPKAVKPFIDCIKQKGQSLRVRLGYENPNSFGITIPKGTENSTTPDTSDKDQPTEFIPGIHHRAWTVKGIKTGQFEWTLRSERAIATAASPQCHDESDNP